LRVASFDGLGMNRAGVVDRDGRRVDEQRALLSRRQGFGVDRFHYVAVGK
jgi:hypothetical protein